MDIVEILENDHDRLRRDLVRVKNAVASNALREQLRSFMTGYELHESVEEEILFPMVATLSREEVENDQLFGYEQVHTKIWALLDQLIGAIGTGDVKQIQDAFFKFDAVTEAHLAFEERVLFPVVRKCFPKAQLEELGKKAASRLMRFSVV
jgi:hemerythrin superfamily protein